MNKGAPLDKTS